MPIVVKDLDGTLAGAPYHGGNQLLKELNYTPTVTSHLFAKLEAAGFVIVGKTNTPELGLMPTTEPLAYGPTHNPWDTDAHAGRLERRLRGRGRERDGAARARRRRRRLDPHPASMCGLFGLKPSRGRVSLGPDEVGAVGRARDAPRRDAQRARQRGGARRARRAT